MRARHALVLLALLGFTGFSPAAAHAQGAGEAEQPQWRLEQPLLPGASWPVPLGNVGDIEFYEGEPNHGLLITGGNKPSVEAGIWSYNGERWQELSNKCGAEREGRIAWAGPEEFWTVSDGRPGQAAEAIGTSEERVAPLNGNTLCHFQNGQITASYAHPAFEADSYQQMYGAACLQPNDCWFGGEPLPEPQIGAFQLHWDGSSLEAEPYAGEGFPIRDMLAFEGHIYESVRLEIPPDRTERSEQLTTPVLHLINPAGAIPPFEPEDEAGAGLPFYEEGEPPQDLGYFHLSAADGTLWAVAQSEGSPGQLTIAVREDGIWHLVIGPNALGAKTLERILPEEDRAEEEALIGSSPSQAKVTAIAAEPGTGSLWIGLERAESEEAAVLVQINASGEVLSEQTLPGATERREGAGEKGAVAKLTCPREEDCWMATSKGWLYHFAPASERTLQRDEDPDFEHLISYRPPDQGLPQVAQDAPPEDVSGFRELGVDEITTVPETKEKAETNKVTLPLVSDIHGHLHKGSMFELSFKLSVRARVRLLAKRHKQVVAQTATHMFKAGHQKLLMQLNPRRWPEHFSLQTKALQPLRVVSSVGGEGANINTVTTSVVSLQGLPQALPRTWQELLL